MRTTRILLSLATLSLILAFGSCVMLEDADLTAPLAALIRHENTVVAAPSIAGAVLGGVAGLPLSLIALPVTLPIAIAAGDMMILLPFMPMIATAEIGAIALGGPVWLLAGWW